MKSIIRRMVVAFSIRNRRRKADLISQFASSEGCRTAILVGAVEPGHQANESIVELRLEEQVTVVAAFNVYPAKVAWPFAVADARSMPYRDNAADLLVSNAVIEHVGDVEDQQRFMAEHSRVGRAWVISTPNRWFPIESHTSTICKHWLPRWRDGRTEFTRLLSLREFKKLLPPGVRVIGHAWSPTFTAFGVTADA